MSEFRNKATKGLFWSFLDNSSNQIIQFITGIILARLLSPREFGLIGMLTFFIAISQSFIDSGFSSALIRKKNCSQDDYSTIFFFNLIVGAFFCLVLITFSGFISDFFNEPQLKTLLQVLSLGLVINAFTIIQKTEITKRIDFHLQMRISVISAIFSGVVGISLAFSGFGVWSLVAKILSGYLFTSILLWIWNRWRPALVFKLKSLTELFSFGGKILLAVILNTIFQNIYLLVIGKVYTASELGFYTRADQFKAVTQQNLTMVVERVTYPLFSEIQDNNARLLSGYKKLLKHSMFISFLMMFVLSAISKSLVITLIGEKWIVSASYLQLLCFAGVFYPLQSLNRNILMVKNRSDLILKLEILKKMIFIPIILVGVLLSIKAMIISLIVLGIVESFLDSYYSSKLINYSFLRQLADISLLFLTGVVVGAVTFLSGLIPVFSNFMTLLIQLLVSFIATIIISEIFRIEEYFEYKSILISKLGI